MIATLAHGGLLHRLDAAQFPARVVNYADSRSHHGWRPWAALLVERTAPLPRHRLFLLLLRARAPPSLSFRRPTVFLPSYPSLSRSLSRFPLFFPPYDSLRWLRTTKIGASPRLRLTRYYLQRTYVTFRTAYYCDYRRIMRRPNVLQFIIELL